jgi:hypothetical protein
VPGSNLACLEFRDRTFLFSMQHILFSITYWNKNMTFMNIIQIQRLILWSLIGIFDLKSGIFINHNWPYITEKEGDLQSIHFSPQCSDLDLIYIADRYWSQFIYLCIHSLIFTCIWTGTTWDEPIFVFNSVSLSIGW